MKPSTQQRVGRIEERLNETGIRFDYPAKGYFFIVPDQKFAKYPDHVKNRAGLIADILFAPRYYQELEYRPAKDITNLYSKP